MGVRRDSSGDVHGSCIEGIATVACRNLYWFRIFDIVCRHSTPRCAPRRGRCIFIRKRDPPPRGVLPHKFHCFPDGKKLPAVKPPSHPVFPLNFFSSSMIFFFHQVNLNLIFRWYSVLSVRDDTDIEIDVVVSILRYYASMHLDKTSRRIIAVCFDHIFLWVNFIKI